MALKKPWQLKAQTSVPSVQIGFDLLKAGAELAWLTSLAETYHQNSSQSHSKSIFDFLMDCYHVFTSVANATYLEHIRFMENTEVSSPSVKAKIRLFSKDNMGLWKVRGM